MKKALVLGILAIFAISINVNAQGKDDPTAKDPKAGQTQTQTHFQQAPANQQATTTSGTIHQQGAVSTGQTVTSHSSSVNANSANMGSAKSADNSNSNRQAFERRSNNSSRRVNDLNAIPPQGKKPETPTNKDVAPKEEEPDIK